MDEVCRGDILVVIFQFLHLDEVTKKAELVSRQWRAAAMEVTNLVIELDLTDKDILLDDCGLYHAIWRHQSIEILRIGSAPCVGQMDLWIETVLRCAKFRRLEICGRDVLVSSSVDGGLLRCVSQAMRTDLHSFGEANGVVAFIAMATQQLMEVLRVRAEVAVTAILITRRILACTSLSERLGKKGRIPDYLLVGSLFAASKGHGVENLTMFHIVLLRVFDTSFDHQCLVRFYNHEFLPLVGHIIRRIFDVRNSQELC